MNNEFYTLKDLIEMTKLSERTLRRYLESGLLTGAKVGGTWRFTEGQVKDLFNAQSFNKEFARQASEDVKQFVRRQYRDNDEDRACVIYDFNAVDESTHEAIRDVVMHIPKHFKGYKMKMHPEDNYLRVILIGSLAFITYMNDALNKVRS